jgi:hypothetical protein
MTNPFEALADRQIVAPRKARMRVVEKRADRRAEKREKALAERDALFHLWKLYRRERFDTLLAGPHGNAVRELIQFLKSMNVEDGPELVEFVRKAGWAHTDGDTRFEVLSLINASVTTMRERAGLLPFDDPVSDEETSAFFLIKELFR